MGWLFPRPSRFGAKEPAGSGYPGRTTGPPIETNRLCRGRMRQNGDGSGDLVRYQSLAGEGAAVDGPGGRAGGIHRRDRDLLYW